VCSLEAPELASLEVKRKLVQKVESAIAAAYQGLANTEDVLVLVNHYPLENVGWRQSLQSDNPEIVAAIAALNR
jgi:phenylpyruvate tautomerase PptA (4-oxalocrotonate tautomerase family)